MPNWCDNYLVLEHDDPQAIRDFCDAYNDGETMQAFLPCPEDLLKESRVGFPGWYEWRIENWGTKWDFGRSGDMPTLSPSDKDGSVRLSFDTAWGPPIAFYKHLESLGYTVEAYYYEPGCDFCGKFVGGEDYSYSIPRTLEELRHTPQSEILSVMNIEEAFEECP